ncbi:MAG: recombination regulator RecX [Candidatus Binatia bacterium]|nr:recombination regulator RecX [Candidatus Binatia bacterium]
MPARGYSSATPLDYAYRLLARRAYSEAELRQALLRNGFSATTVASALTRLKDQGYLDDTSLAHEHAERLRERGFGRSGIQARLAQKGFSPDVVEQVSGIGGQAEEERAARHLLARRFSADALQTPRLRARAFRLLLRRGFSPEVAESLLGSGADDDYNTSEGG